MKLWVGIAVLAVLGGAFLLGRGNDTVATAIDPVAAQTEQGYVALDAQIVETAEDGAPLYALEAARIEQRPSTGDVTLHQLTMHYHLRADSGAGVLDGQDEQSSWRLQANEGRLPGGSTRVSFTGAVRATGELPESKLPAELTTEQLDFDTKTQDLTSHQRVIIRVAGQRLTARGITANLKQERVRLESAVHGRYSR